MWLFLKKDVARFVPYLGGIEIRYGSIEELLNTGLYRTLEELKFMLGAVVNNSFISFVPYLGGIEISLRRTQFPTDERFVPYLGGIEIHVPLFRL